MLGQNFVFKMLNKVKTHDLSFELRAFGIDVKYQKASITYKDSLRGVGLELFRHLFANIILRSLY